jgi:hypothetical protein
MGADEDQLTRNGPRRPEPAGQRSRRRLFLLATAFVARGMPPEEAYAAARYYVDGSGRGQTWISALAEHEADGPPFS